MLEVFDVSPSLTWRSQNQDSKDTAGIACFTVIYHLQSGERNSYLKKKISNMQIDTWKAHKFDS